MNKKVERGRATREQLIEIATPLFAGRGYEDTSIEAVLQDSGVSRGALYHHFAGKEGLFQAVHEAVEAKIDQEIARATQGIDDPVAALRAGCLTWVRSAGDPIVQRILLIDAPAVFGWRRWRELEEQHSLGMIKVALQAISDTGRLPAHLVTPFAHMLLAALNEIAIVIARSDDTDDATREGEGAVEALLQRLLVP
ncbi:MAG TPA: TetR/AcrR family transcriptional regulator [Streptosporangiaceae bacterium]|nr:TetR/AcrR family transcriptional regulator [Streptosporangiaceae bacterium]